MADYNKDKIKAIVRRLEGEHAGEVDAAAKILLKMAKANGHNLDEMMAAVYGGGGGSSSSSASARIAEAALKMALSQLRDWKDQAAQWEARARAAEAKVRAQPQEKPKPQPEIDPWAAAAAEAMKPSYDFGFDPGGHDRTFHWGGSRSYRTHNSGSGYGQGFDARGRGFRPSSYVNHRIEELKKLWEEWGADILTAWENDFTTDMVNRGERYETSVNQDAVLDRIIGKYKEYARRAGSEEAFWKA